MPPELAEPYVERLIDAYLEPRGKLLVAQYWSRRHPVVGPTVDKHLTQLGIHVEKIVSGFEADGYEATRIAVVKNPSPRR